MRPDHVPAYRWPRYATAMVAALWALGIAAGCHVAHLGSATHQASPSSTVRGAHSAGALAHPAPFGAGSCSPMDQGCKHVAQACSTTDLVALAVVVVFVALAGSLAWPAAPVSRGPPRPAGFTPYRSGRNILTRNCIARI